MTNRNSTKNVWILSVISLVLCMSMLVGTTFAWFTDNATTGVNTIVAGNLDIALYKGTVTGAAVSYTDEVNEQTLLFSDTALWEPGYTEVAYLKVENKGTLALKALVNVNFTNEQEGINAAGEPFKLSDYLMYDLIDITENTFYATRTDALNAAMAGAKKIATETNEIKLVSKDVKYYALVVYMPETVGNEANYRNVKPSIQLGVNVFATQDTVERDNFDDQYDNGAQYDKADVWDGETNTEFDGFNINSADDFAAFAAAVNGGKTYEGETVKLNKSIDLNNLSWTSIGTFAGTFEGNGNTISNLNNATLFNTVTETGVVKNLNLEDVSASSSIGAFLVLNLKGRVEKCSMKNAVITTENYNSAGMIKTATGNAVVDNCYVDGFTLTVNATTDNGDKVGGLVGFASGANVKITNSAVSNITLNGGQKTKQWGGLVGFLQYASVENCTATNVEINVINYAQSVGGFVGAVADGKITNCKADDVTIKIATGGHVGGFCGYTGQANYYDFEDCHVTGLTITLETDTVTGIGGFSGRAAFTTTVKNCSVEGTINASETAIAGGNIKALVGQEYEGGSVYEGNTANVTIN